MKKNRFYTPKMRWQPKGTSETIYEPSIAQSLVFGQTAAAELVDPLIDNLKHAWMMNDDGTQTDEVSTKDLNAGNSPVRVAGKIGFAQQYASGVARRHWNSVAPAWGSNNWDFALSLWVRTDAQPTTIDWYYFNVENNTGNVISVRQYLPTGNLMVYLSPDSGTTQYIVESNVTPTNGVWYHVMMQYIQDTSIQMWVNNVNKGTTGAAGGYANGRVVTGARVWSGTGSGNVSVDAIHFWDNYALTSDDRAYMFNSGAGRELF